jgi:hypothetical protein
MRYHITLEILDKDYIDQLVTALVRQGYSVYFNEDCKQKGVVCFDVYDTDIQEIKE